jgi:hypothetical protein
MESLNRPLMYALSDALGIELYVDKETWTVTGETSRDVNLGGLRLTVPVKVVSSALTPNGYMVLAKVLGNLALFAVAKRVGNKDVVDLHVLNIAKTDRLSGYLEKTNPKSVNDVVKELEAGIVKSYVKLKKNEWGLAA